MRRLISYRLARLAECVSFLPSPNTPLDSFVNNSRGGVRSEPGSSDNYARLGGRSCGPLRSSWCRSGLLALRGQGPLIKSMSRANVFSGPTSNTLIVIPSAGGDNWGCQNNWSERDVGPDGIVSDKGNGQGALVCVSSLRNWFCWWRGPVEFRWRRATDFAMQSVCTSANPHPPDHM